MNINDSQIQMTLDLDTHLTERFRSASSAALPIWTWRRAICR